MSTATAMEGLTETATEIVVEGSTAIEGSTATGTAMNLTVMEGLTATAMAMEGSMPTAMEKAIDGACVNELLIESVSTDTFVFDRPGKMKL